VSNTPQDRSPASPHRARQIAESFGEDAARYDRARPRYPDALVQRIITSSPGRDVLDVGIGTGIAARQFQAAGCTVLGIDPDARMAAFARDSGCKVEVAKIEDWDPAGRLFDLVIAGQTWHWVDPVAGAVTAARALRPGGRVAAFWHVFDPPPPVSDAFNTIFRQLVPDAPFNPGTASKPTLDMYLGMAATASDGFRATGRFDEAEQWQFHWEHHYTRDAWLDLQPTIGGLAKLPPEKLSLVLDSVGAAIDAMGGGFTLPYTTLVVTASKNDAN
jgi:SAM-dependent methyltransferase